MHFTEQWWQRYAAWDEETRKPHDLLIDACQAIVSSRFSPYRDPFATVVDLGCGRLLMGRRFPHMKYVGIDIEPVQPFHGQDARCSLQGGNFQTMGPEAFAEVFDNVPRRRGGFVDGNVVVSLFGVELYSTIPSHIYSSAFEGGADVFISSGIRYLSTPEHETAEEPGSVVWQSTPFARTDTIYDTVTLVSPVPSKMFGDVQEIWHVMTRKG